MATVPDELADVDLVHADDATPLEVLPKAFGGERPFPAPTVHQQPYRFSVEQYEAMTSAGVLGQSDRVELIYGVVVEKMTKGSEHQAIANELVDQLSEIRFSTKAPLHVSQENPVRIVSRRSEPEPDISVVRGAPLDYRGQVPSGTDLLLAIEVADSSVEKDLARAPLYAAAGIPAYLLVDVTARTLTLYTQLTDNEYASAEQVDAVPVVLDGEVLGTVTAAEIFPAEPDGK